MITEFIITNFDSHAKLQNALTIIKRVLRVCFNNSHSNRYGMKNMTEELWILKSRKYVMQIEAGHDHPDVVIHCFSIKIIQTIFDYRNRF